jgi:hypothetical protein
MFGMTRNQTIVIAILLLFICMLLGLFGVLLLYGNLSRLSATQGLPQSTIQPQTGFIDTIQEFDNSRFCKHYDCVLAGRTDDSGSTDNMYTIGNYPNQYNDILIEVITTGNEISDFGITLDGLTPSRPHLNNEDLQFVYDFLSSVSNTDDLDPTFKLYVQQNIEVSIEQICLATSYPFDPMRIWAGKVREPTITISKVCPIPQAANQIASPIPEEKPTIQENTSTFVPTLPTPTVYVPVPTETPLPPDSTIKIQNWQIQVVKVDTVEQINFQGEIRKANGRFALLYLSVTNVGNVTNTFVGTFSYLDIVDNNFVRYEEDFVASFEAQVQKNMDMNGFQIAPGETRTVLVVYDISKDGDSYYLEPGLLEKEFKGKVSLEVP